MILSRAEERNLNSHRKDTQLASVRPDLTRWAKELEQRIVDSDDEAASLRARADSLKSRADALLQMAATSDAKAAAMRGLLQQIEVTKEQLSPETPDTSTKSKKTAGPLAALVRQRAKEILKAAGRPMGRTEILALLLEDGIDIPGEKPAQRVGKILWMSDDFEYRDNGYWLAGESILPDAVPKKRFRAPNRIKNPS